jgi:hypothetical protein
MSRFRQVFLAIAIAIVFAFFVGFGIEAFYESPKYEKYCTDKSLLVVETQKQCEDNDGKWTNTQATAPIMEKIPTANPNQYVCDKIGETVTNITFTCQTVKQLSQAGYCDLNYYCNQNFQDDLEKHNRNVFIVAVVFGIIALVAGIILKLTSVSSGLMGGGILTIVYGIIRYWSGLQNYGRFGVMAVALVVLVWLGYKKLKD